MEPKIYDTRSQDPVTHTKFMMQYPHDPVVKQNIKISDPQDHMIKIRIEDSQDLTT